VISLANGDSVDEGCSPRWPEEWRKGLALNTLKGRHITGQASSPFVSVTIDMVWMLYFATKSILLKQETKAVMVEVDLEAYEARVPNKLVDLSTYRSLIANGLSLWEDRGIWATRASEVLTCGIVNGDLTGQVWVLDKNTDSGRELLELAGSDREVNSDGSLNKFGSFLPWFNAFHERYSTAGERKLFSALQVRARKPAAVEAGTSRKRKPTATVKAANEAAAEAEARGQKPRSR
jgi:hypothetical protein